MGWRDQLQSATFRGVPFDVDVSSGQLGRRTQLHEYPLKDKPFVEDLGRRSRELSFDGFIAGADYMAGRDRLIGAVDEAGPGTLVHPYYGRVQVTVTAFRLRESTKDGGIVRFTLTCIESGDNVFPAATDDTAGIVDKRADTALEATKSGFEKAFDVAKKPGFVAAEAVAFIQGGIENVRDINARVARATAPISNLSNTLNALSNELVALVNIPRELAAELAGVLVALGGVVNRPAAAVRAYKGLYGFGDDSPQPNRATPNRQQQGNNQAAVKQLVQQVAVIEATRAAAKVQFAPSINNSTSTVNPGERVAWASDDVRSMRETLGAQLDKQMAAITPTGAPVTDEIYTALTDLRVAMVNDLVARSGPLPQLVAYTPPQTMPAILIAYQLYGDVNRANEIVARNNIRHPGFVPGGVPLEVLGAV